DSWKITVVAVRVPDEERLGNWASLPPVNLVLHKWLARHRKDGDLLVNEHRCDRKHNLSWFRGEGARSCRAKDSDHGFAPFVRVPTQTNVNGVLRELQLGMFGCLRVNFLCNPRRFFSQGAPGPIAHFHCILFKRCNCVVWIYVARRALQEDAERLAGKSVF